MDVHCGGFQGNDDRSDDDGRRNGDPAYEQEFPRGFLYRCALERTRSDRGRESFLRSRGHAQANRPDAKPRAKGGVTTSDPTMAKRMPALFIGHGNPMNALLVNPYTQRWASIGATLPKPKAILSAAFRASYIRCNIQRPVIPTSLRASRNCLLMCRCVATTAGVSTTVLGRFCATSIHKPIFQWFNSALMKRNRPRSTTKSASAWRSYEKKAFSSSVAATSCTTCMPMLGDGTHRSRTIGRSRLKLESASCSSRESTSRS